MSSCSFPCLAALGGRRSSRWAGLRQLSVARFLHQTGLGHLADPAARAVVSLRSDRPAGTVRVSAQYAPLLLRRATPGAGVRLSRPGAMAEAAGYDERR